MFSIKNIVSKSKEFVSTTGFVNLDTNTSTRLPKENESNDISSQSMSNTIGEAYLITRSLNHDKIIIGHQQLLQSGQQLNDTFLSVRKKLQDQIECSQYLQSKQFDDTIIMVKEKMKNIRSIVVQLSDELHETEEFLLEKLNERYIMETNILQQQSDWEMKKLQTYLNTEILDAQKIEMDLERKRLSEAFQKDLQTYKEGNATIISQSFNVDEKISSRNNETLEMIDLPVDTIQLDAFYTSSSEDEEGIEKEQAMEALSN